MIHQSFWLPGYSEKWICKQCHSTHFYLPAGGCQKCKSKNLEKVSNMAVVRVESDVLNLKIDNLRLEKEWTNHPEQFHKCARLAADAQFAYDCAKSKLVKVSADLNRQIREEFAEEKVKATKDEVDSAVQIDPLYLSADQKVNETRHALELAKADVQSLEHKKRALTLLVELWVKEYYSEKSGSAPQAISEEGEMFGKEAIRRRGLLRRKHLTEQDEQGQNGDDD